MIDKGNIIILINGTNNKFNIGDNKLIELKLFIRIGMLPKKDIKLIETYNKLFSKVKKDIKLI